MASSDNKSPAANTDHVHESIIGQTAAPANTQDQMLLKALQAFIVPLIRAVGQTKEIDINEIALGPEARKLITALQEFISSVMVCTQSDRQPTAIKVNLAEDESALHTQVDDNGEGSLTRAEAPPYSLGGIMVEQRALEKYRIVFHNELLKALREHVFNKMPIRLLHFEPLGSALQISLLERGAIYARLESVFRASMHEEEFRHQYLKSLGRLETNEEAIRRLVLKYSRYAILSHTWLRTMPGEVTYAEWNKGIFDVKNPGYQKLVNFSKASWKHHGLAFGWMDTVCINKESSTELDESIRSMYGWYSRAHVCITYLAETGKLSTMHLDSWFTRGWTFQELVAPHVLKFYNGDWNLLIEGSENDRGNKSITNQIQRATTISVDELANIHNSPISRRMQLAATREVTREEDTAYSLMGIFNVSISTAYGEGAERAFFRLLQEILVSSKITLDVFNWAGSLAQSPPNSSTMFPTGPQYYLNRSPEVDSLSTVRATEPLIYTHLGLRVPVILMPGFNLSLNGIQSPHYKPVGDYHAVVEVSQVVRHGDYISRADYTLLDKRIIGSDGYQKRRNDSSKEYQTTFAVFNFEGDETTIKIPTTCIAKGIRCTEDAGKVTGLGLIDTLETTTPIVFQLNKVGRNRSKVTYVMFPHRYYEIRRDELVRHGIQLLTLYL